MEAKEWAGIIKREADKNGKGKKRSKGQITRRDWQAPRKGGGSFTIKLASEIVNQIYRKIKTVT